MNERSVDNHGGRPLISSHGTTHGANRGAGHGSAPGGLRGDHVSTVSRTGKARCRRLDREVVDGQNQEHLRHARPDLEKIDGVEAGSVGRTSHAYVLPGEHEFQVRFIQVKGYHLVCGALCDAIFNEPKLVKAATLPGHVYTLRYIDDRDGTVVLDDRGTDYDRRCLKVREFSEGTGC